MTDVIMIPLTKLVESEDNVRRANRKGGVSELASSIRSHGLLQSLVVRDTERGKYAVIAGGRRLRALRLLAKAGDIERNAPIPCRVLTGEDNATELSLAENVARLDLPVHEELDAFQRLALSGEGPEAIAARFGVSPMHVARRLKLARVSPRLIEALKREEASLDQLAALAVVDDHAAQEKAFFDTPDWARTPAQLKAQVTQAHVPGTDKLARFVGLDAYQAAGGAIVPDLFAETDDGTRYLADRDLLLRLAAEKLEPIAAQVREEAWAWVEIALDGVAWTQFPDRVRERRRVLSDADQAEYDSLVEKLDVAEDDAEAEALEARIDALAVTSWAPEEVALAGAIITINQDGAPKIERGLVKQDDHKALKALRRRIAKADGAAQPSEGEDGDPETKAARSRPRLPAKLVEELIAHKTLALRTEVATKPDLALRLLILALASNALNEFSAFSLVRVRIDEADVSRQITRSESLAPQALAKLTGAWRERLPAGVDALWAFIAAADQQTLIELLAVLVAPAIELRPGRADGVVDAICRAAGLDMSRYWRVSVESYFEHVRKDVIVDAIMELNPALDRSKLDKASKKEVLSRAKKAFKGSAWLPEPLRAAPASPAPVQAIAAE
ncbi:MAG: chromosome partitioning protein ParB [Alphaproteobacteria bacterium]|nr:MAG: chromosome partitioning protein ParB [Alphaproteobacteria bacterium]